MRRTKYHRIFIAHHGDLPLPCSACEELVTAWGRHSDDGCIHHLDRDRSNNTLSNLALMHVMCHHRHHASECLNLGPKSPETRAKISAALTGRKQSAETQAKRSASLKRAYAEGRHKLPPGLPKGVKPRRTPCPSCGREISLSNLSRHVCGSRHR